MQNAGYYLLWIPHTILTRLQTDFESQFQLQVLRQRRVSERKCMHGRSGGGGGGGTREHMSERPSSSNQAQGVAIGKPGETQKVLEAQIRKM